MLAEILRRQFGELPLSSEAEVATVLALEEALATEQDTIDTGALLIGISQVKPTDQILADREITLAEISTALSTIRGYEKPKLLLLGRSTFHNLHDYPMDDRFLFPTTLRMRKIGLIAFELAQHERRKIVEPQDLLASIVKEGSGIGARILRGLNFI